MKTNSSNLLVAATTALIASTMSLNLPAQALTWTINEGSMVDTIPTPTPITGSFTIDNSQVTESNIVIDGLTFTAADVDGITPSDSGIEAIDWFDGSNSLALVFNSPFLTTAGGTITLNDIASDFNGDVVSGSVTSMQEPTANVPEPSTIIGLMTTLGFCIFSKEGLQGKAKKQESEFH